MGHDRELVERPQTGTDPLADSRYYNQADVRILIDGSNIHRLPATGTALEVMNGELSQALAAFESAA